MAKFLSCTELYEVIQKKSSEAKEVLWTCSPHLGLGAHEVFSQEIVKNPPVDVRFVFRFSDVSVKTGEVNPYEVQYFLEHFGNSNVKSNDTFHSTIFVFDNSALITSANLTKAAFESDIEAGVLLDNSEAVEVKSFFETSLWENAIQVRDFKKYKKIWNTEKRSGIVGQRKKAKTHTKIRNWMDDYVSTWYFSILDKIAKKAERKIHKEANWPKALKLVGDIGPTAFRQVKLGDLAFMADLSKKKTKQNKC